jgi:hypothetical protein
MGLIGSAARAGMPGIAAVDNLSLPEPAGGRFDNAPLPLRGGSGGSGFFPGTEAYMGIDIDNLSEAQLRELHGRITARLRLLLQVRAHGQMLNFAIGERVVFHSQGRHIEGMLTRFNRKTVTVITDEGEHWNVSPGLLSRIAQPAESKPHRPAPRAPIVIHASAKLSDAAGQAGAPLPFSQMPRLPS